jgi:hypothetical protein
LIVGAPRNYAAMPSDKTGGAAVASELRAAVQQLAQEHAGR